jgi:hypothetical protein
VGRNREYRNRVAITAYLESEEFQALEDIRWRDHKDITQVIRAAVIDYVKAHGSGNETFRLDEWTKDPDFKAVPTILSDPQIWYRYLQDCTPEDRARILKQTNIIRTNAINIGNLRK